MAINSAVVIARLLSTEGFTDFLSNQVKQYALTNATDGMVRRWKRTKRAFAEMCKKLTDADKLVLGKMIGTMAKMHFDTGLRIGLTACAQENAKPALQPTCLEE